MNTKPILITIALVLIISALTVFPFMDLGLFDWQLGDGEEPEGGVGGCPMPSPPGNTFGEPSASGTSSGRPGPVAGGSPCGDREYSSGQPGGQGPGPVSPVLPTGTGSSTVVPVPEFPSPAHPAALLGGTLGIALLVRAKYS